MTANTTIKTAANKSALLRTITIVDTADVVDNFDGTYTYGEYDFVSPEVVPAANDKLVINDSGANSLMPAAVYSANYDVVSTETALTDNSGGTASNTIAAMTVTEPANLAAVGAQFVIIQNAIASLAARV
ncbi:MAG TPA: hypothetical protein VEC93_04935 [Anaerolineae bacterium]|nr:hypothetical protein [Anaerolineae bacterium]